MTNLYLDLEWFLNQNVFLIGYAYSLSEYGQLHDETLTVDNLEKILHPVNGYLFFYGHDIKMLE
jgi:TRAP-type mannitol/chloroaromatic compound transport system permease small subunit